MKRAIYTLILILTTIHISMAMSEQEEIELIKSRYRNFHMQKALSEEIIKQYIDSIDLSTGGWSDIDYESMIGSDWRTKEHTRRTMRMAQFHALGDDVQTTLFTRRELSDAIHSAWDYWFREQPYCTTNWYPNRLSCPHELGISFMLMQEEMSEEESINAVKLVFNKSKLEKTGSNLIYVANTALMQGIFQRDVELIHRAIDAISSTICIAKEGEEGIQSDFSYHLHGSQQQMGNYGREAIIVLAPFCEILAGTSFDFSVEQKEILLNLITEGFRWFMWRGYLDMNGSGRQYGPDMFKFKGGTILTSAAQMASAATPEQRVKVAEMIKENDTTSPTTLTGQKFFDKSDCFIHRSSDWTTSLRMHSTRVKATEMSSSDNRRGFFAPDGSLFTYIDGGDYENAAALWDWCKVPGTTCYETDDKLIASPFATNSTANRDINNSSGFVGACSDGTQGIASMILEKDGQFYRKSWIMTPEFILCLGSDLHDKSGVAPLTTSVEQRFLEGSLSMLQDGEWRNIDDKIVISEEGLRLHHHKSGYIILDDNECEASVEDRVGDWTDITIGLDPTSVRGDMVSIFVRHKRQSGDYKYLILPNKSRDCVAKFDTDEINIIANDRDIQLVCSGGQYYATVYTPDVYEIDGEISIDVKQAGIFMFKRDGGLWSVIAHDPTKQISNLEMESKIEVKE
ncbi:MAG: polysaccharide lyase family 8 super-sandwich domain-containing protein [Rikenellaceae bacterium]